MHLSCLDLSFPDHNFQLEIDEVEVKTARVVAGHALEGLQREAIHAADRLTLVEGRRRLGKVGKLVTCQYSICVKFLNIQLLLFADCRNRPLGLRLLWQWLLDNLGC